MICSSIQVKEKHVEMDSQDFKRTIQKVVEIVDNEKFDFLKMSFSEFYGDNSTQWSWYNVPQSVREEVWPDHKKFTKIRIRSICQKLNNNILSHEGLSLLTGEIYYSNWLKLVSRR